MEGKSNHSTKQLLFKQLYIRENGQLDVLFRTQQKLATCLQNTPGYYKGKKIAPFLSQIFKNEKSMPVNLRDEIIKLSIARLANDPIQINEFKSAFIKSLDDGLSNVERRGQRAQQEYDEFQTHSENATDAFIFSALPAEIMWENHSEAKLLVDTLYFKVLQHLRKDSPIEQSASLTKYRFYFPERSICIMFWKKLYKYLVHEQGFTIDEANYVLESASSSWINVYFVEGEEFLFHISHFEIREQTSAIAVQTSVYTLFFRQDNDVEIIKLNDDEKRRWYQMKFENITLAKNEKKSKLDYRIHFAFAPE